MTVAKTRSTTALSRAGRLELAAGVATIALGIAVIVVVPQLRHCVSLAIHGQFGALRTYVHSLGAGGVALLLGLMLAHAIVFYPSEIITATAGYVYGFLPGLAFVVVGWLLAALLSYALGRSVGRPLLQRVLGRRLADGDDGARRHVALACQPAHPGRPVCPDRLRRRRHAHQPVALLMDHRGRLPSVDHRGGLPRLSGPDAIHRQSPAVG